MPSVPLVDQNVEQQGFLVPTPKFATPVKEAYTGIADANAEGSAKLSAMAQGVADKVVQNNLWQEQAKIYDSREKLATDITGIMSSSEMQTIKDADGKEYQVPSGILNRMGTNAKGSADDYMARVAPLKEQYVSQFKMPQLRAQASRQFDSLVASGYRQAAQHEATQVREGVSKTFFDSSMNEVKLATQKATPDDLMDSMEHIHDSYLKYGAFKGMSPEEIVAGVTPMYAKAAENSAMNVLRTTGSIDTAMSQLDAVKTLIPNDYEKISESLTRHNDIMTREVKHQANVTKVQNQFGMISDFATPGATPPTQLDVENMVKSGKVDTTFASDYMSAIKAFDKQKDITGSDRLPYSLGLKDNSVEMQNFGKTMQSIMSSADGKEMQTVLQGAMKDAAKGNFSQDKLKITMFYALQRGKMLDAIMRDDKPVDPALSKMDGGVKSLMDWQSKSGIQDPTLLSSYLDAVNKGTDPSEAYQKTTQDAGIKHNPAIVSIPKTGKTMIDKFGNRAVMFPDGHWESIK